MHPKIKSPKPGKCPECNMNLIETGKGSLKSVKTPKEQLPKKTSEKKPVSSKLLFIALPVFLLSLAWFLWVIWNKVIPHKTQEVHYHAGFIVVKDNKLEDFSKNEYMKIEACKEKSVETDDESPEQEQQEKAHLHDNVGDVVHVENKEALWKDLFSNINYPINYANTTAYENNRQIQNIQDLPIQPFQSLVIFIGENNDTLKFLGQAVTKQHIENEEVKSESCDSH